MNEGSRSSRKNVSRGKRGNKEASRKSFGEGGAHKLSGKGEEIIQQIRRKRGYLGNPKWEKPTEKKN